MLCGRGTVEGFDGLNWVTANDMFVVAVVLGKGFLEDRTVDGFVWGGAGIISGEFSTPCMKWKVVVNNDCVGNAEGVKLYSIDAVLANLIVRIEEDFLHSARMFGKG